MSILQYAVGLLVIQIASAQTVGVNTQNQLNIPTQNARMAPSGAGLPRGLVNGMSIMNQMARNMATTGNGAANAGNNNLMNVANMATVNPNMAKINSAGMGNMNYANQNFMNANLANMNIARGGLAAANMPSIDKRDLMSNGNILTNTGNLANHNLANAILNTNAGARNMAEPSLVNAMLGNANIANPNLIETNLVNANMANPNMANAIVNGNLNPHLAKLNFANGGNTFSGPPGQSFGIHILADALEVGGTVAIAGKMPIYGTVALTGNLPTDGAAAVNYNCS